MRIMAVLGIALSAVACTGASPAPDGPAPGPANPDPTGTSALTSSATATPAPTDPAGTTTASTPPPPPGGSAGTVVAAEVVCPGSAPIFGPGPGKGAARDTVVIIDSAAAAAKELGCSGAGIDFTKHRVAMFRLQGVNESYTMTSVRREKDAIVLEPSIFRLCRGAAMGSSETFLVLLDAGTEPVRLTPIHVPMERPCLAP